jgi:hypothetical protein
MVLALPALLDAPPIAAPAPALELLAPELPEWTVVSEPHEQKKRTETPAEIR